MLYPQKELVKAGDEVKAKIAVFKEFEKDFASSLSKLSIKPDTGDMPKKKLKNFTSVTNERRHKLSS